MFEIFVIKIVYSFTLLMTSHLTKYTPQLIEYCPLLGNSLELIIYVGAKFMQE